MRPKGLALTTLPQRFGICRLPAGSRIPRWVHSSIFSSISRSPDELSIVAEERTIPRAVDHDRGWRALRVLGPLDLSLIGVLASLAEPLREAEVSLFSVSTYDTDYLLVRDDNLRRATRALEAAGHRVEGSPEDVGGVAAERPEQGDERRKARGGRQPRETRDGERETERRPKRSRVRDDEPKGERKTETETERRPRRSRGRDDEPKTERKTETETERRPRRGLSRDDEVKDEPKDERKTDTETERRPKRSRSRDDEAKAATGTSGSDATQGESIAALADDDEPDDERVRSEGLFTGAIPQHGVELTDIRFENLGLSKPILETIAEVGFEYPTPIQAAVIPEALEGVDVIGLAETGSGKTAAFCLPLAEKLTHGRGVRGLILCPTREIALQTKAFLDIFGRDHDLESVAVIGGVRMGPQIDDLRKQPDILVATPGRLADHLRRRNVRLDDLEELVIDEADHMLDLGFLPQIQEILEQAPKERRTMMFSATMLPPIERLAQRFMRDPLHVDIRPAGQVAEGIEHRLYLVGDDDMKDCVRALLEEIEGSTLIFVRRKLYTEWLARQLDLAGLPVERIHSDRSQSQRVRALRSFREGKKRILVATDVAARGIDVPLIQHVINYGFPEQVEDYIHRAGRTARGNAVGLVSTIGTWKDRIMIRDIERVLGKKIPRCTVEGVEPWKELKQRKTVRRRRML